MATAITIPRIHTPLPGHGHGEQDHGVLDAVESVAFVGQFEVVALTELPGLVAGDNPDPAPEYLQGGGARALVLLEAGPPRRASRFA